MKNKREKGIRELVSNGEDIKNFVIVELDILRGDPGSTFKTLVKAKDEQGAIEIFYGRFPSSSSHIMVIPDEYATEHYGYVVPKVAIKVQKKRPLIKLE